MLGAVRITVDSVVLAGVPEAEPALCNQGDFSGGFPTVVTDDPSVGRIAYPTVPR